MKSTFIEYNQKKYLLDFVEKNMEIMKSVVAVYSGNVEDIYEMLMEEITYVEKSFKKNYFNGSHKEVALEVLSAMQQDMLEHVSEFSKINDCGTNTMLMYLVSFITSALVELIMELDKMSDPFLKSSLIKKYTGNIKSLISSTNIRQTELKCLSEEEAMNRFGIYFYSIDGNIKLAQQKSNYTKEQIEKMLTEI